MATIRNKNTRLAYARAVRDFLEWCAARGVTLGQIEPVVAASIEQHQGATPTVKQQLAAIRMLFDWLVTGQVVPVHPAWSVRRSKHGVKRSLAHPTCRSTTRRTTLPNPQTLIGVSDECRLVLPKAFQHLAFGLVSRFHEPVVRFGSTLLPAWLIPVGAIRYPVAGDRLE